jgi:hypothetical protein
MPCWTWTRGLRVDVAFTVAMQRLFAHGSGQSLGNLLTTICSLLAGMNIQTHEIRLYLALHTRINRSDSAGMIPEQSDLRLSRVLFAEIADLVEVDSSAILAMIDALIV